MTIKNEEINVNTQLKVEADRDSIMNFFTNNSIKFNARTGLPKLLNKLQKNSDLPGASKLLKELIPIIEGEKEVEKSVKKPKVETVESITESFNKLHNQLGTLESQQRRIKKPFHQIFATKRRVFMLMENFKRNN